MKEENIIFLDIDGCVTNARNGWFNLDIYVINYLRWICEKADVKIVISSTWRYSHLKPFWLTIFGQYLHEDWATPSTKLSGCRGLDIKGWLDAHPNTKKYLILDDDSDMLPNQFPNFIKTSGHDGMLLEHYMKVKEFWGITEYMHDISKPYIHKNMFAYHILGEKKKRRETAKAKLNFTSDGNLKKE